MEVARVLRDLKQRGLRGGSLGIVVADGAGGIEAAASEVYPWAKFQRCCWHHLQSSKHNASSSQAGRRMMQEAARCYFQAHLDQTLTYL